MTEFTVYAPRKVTPQNRRHLPSNHDPNKRNTYVLITLDEAEIQTAIRNHLRAQMPIDDNDDLPVVLTAGRGENGHTAAVTVMPIPYSVISPVQPAASMSGFTEVNTQALERMASKEEAEEKPVEQQVRASAAAQVPTSNNPNRLPPSKQAEAIADEPQEVSEEPIEETVAETPAPAPKKSSLFGDGPKTETVAELKPAAEAPSEEAPKPKPKSIFDAL